MIKQVALLDRTGEIIDIFSKKKTGKFSSEEIFPLVIENYIWDPEKQARSAERYKDQIKRVFYPDCVDKKTKIMLQDDIRRLDLIKQFNYGKKVLEVGCSDGSVSIKIAEIPEVKKIYGIDIRKSAIEDGKKLIKDLVKRKEIDKKTAEKVELKHSSIENFPLTSEKFDSVCAYEVFEHMAPQDMLPAFQHLYNFLKRNGNFFISVPNRFPDKKYDRLGRSRWKWFDHRNFFSKASLENFLKSFFEDVKFHPLYSDEKTENSLYLICECNGKKHDK